MKKRKSPHNEIKLDRILHFAMCSIWLLLLLFVLFIAKCTTYASSGDTNSYFPMAQTENGKFTEAMINLINSTFNPYDTNNIFVYNYEYWGDRYNCYVCVFPKDEYNFLCGEINNNGYQWSPYKVGNYTLSIYLINIPPNASYCNIYQGYNLSSLQNIPSSKYNTNVSYYSNFRVKTNNTDSASTVLSYGWELPPDFMHDTSHATPPDTFESPVYTTGHTPPTNVPPTYTINNYSWTTYTAPTLDTSNAEALLESIYNAIVYNGQYLKDNIHGELTNLVNNIGGFFEYIGDTIQYYGNLIISNIQNGITTFYNNINSAIVGIGNAVGYITQPLDMDNLTNAVNSTHIWGDVDTCTTFASDAFGIYGTVAEPNSFKIPFDLRSISLLNITQVYYIDLSWLDGAKTAIRAFMWCVVTFGLLYSVIVDIPNMIKSSK